MDVPGLFTVLNSGQRRVHVFLDVTPEANVECSSR